MNFLYPAFLMTDFNVYILPAPAHVTLTPITTFGVWSPFWPKVEILWRKVQILWSRFLWWYFEILVIKGRDFILNGRDFHDCSSRFFIMSGRDFHDDFRSRISGKFRSVMEPSHYAVLMGNCQTILTNVFVLSIHWIV